MPILKRTRLLVLWTVFPACATAGDIWSSGGDLEFERSEGQTSVECAYILRTASGAAFLTDSGMRLGDGTGFDFVGGSAGAVWETGPANGNTTSYYLGRRQRPELLDLPHYRSVVRRRVYPGVDVIWYGRNGRLEFDFILAPHADPTQIQIRFAGNGRSRGADGGLEWATSATNLTVRRPFIYQTAEDGSRKIVAGGWRRMGRDRAAVSLGTYDSGLPLVIDPVAEFNTYVGGSGEDEVVAARTQNLVVGTTGSLDFPGAQTGYRGGSDIFVTIGPQGSRRTLIVGGSGVERVTSVSSASSVSWGILIGGYTTSTDLPVRAPVPAVGWVPWQKYYAGGNTDGFLLFVGAPYLQGGGLGQPEPFLTYIGTPGEDRVTGVHLETAIGATGFGASLPFAVCGSTNGRGMPRGFVASLEEPESSGGLDIFFMWGRALTGSPSQDGPVLTSTTYFGGSGDDVPYSVERAVSGGPFTYYIGGETSSADFPVVNGDDAGLKGRSDGFVIGVAVAGSAASSSGVRFGGNGWDRVSAMAATGDELLIGGATSSTDFELLPPSQPPYGGGPSDAFLVRFHAGLENRIGSRLIGGSGEDVATTIAHDYFGGVHMGGWTRSADFPTLDAIQPQYGGAASDGFVVYVDPSGSLLQSTYLGGAGEDRVASLYTNDGLLWAGGQTSSPDLAVQDAEQSRLQGASDGFIARLNPRRISAPSSVVGAKGYRAAFSVLLAIQEGELTVRSSDSSKVSGARYGSLNRVYFDCLVDHGGAELTVASPGFADAVVRVECRPAVIEAYTSPDPYPIPRPAPFLVFRLAATDAEGVPLPPQPVELTLPPGADPVAIQFSSSNPELGPVSEDCPITAGLSYCTARFGALQPGRTTLSFSAPGLPIVPSSIVVEVPGVSKARFNPSSLSLPAGFQYRLLTSGGQAQTMALVSPDPSGVVISPEPQRAGTESLAYTFSQRGATGAFYIQALAPGQYMLRFSAEGQEDTLVPVTVTAPVARLRPPAPFATPMRLKAGETAQFTVSVTADGSSLAVMPNPGVRVRLAMRSSNASAVRVSPDAAELAGTATSLQFTVAAVAEGITTLSLELPEGYPVVPAQQQMPIVVLSGGPQ
ncbi:MAG: hypothetical protein U0R19_36705 [Bryobacteraceae bacterium]